MEMDSPSALVNVARITDLIKEHSSHDPAEIKENDDHLKSRKINEYYCLLVKIGTTIKLLEIKRKL